MPRAKVRVHPPDFPGAGSPLVVRVVGPVDEEEEAPGWYNVIRQKGVNGAEEDAGVPQFEAYWRESTVKPVPEQLFKAVYNIPGGWEIHHMRCEDVQDVGIEE